MAGNDRSGDANPENVAGDEPENLTASVVTSYRQPMPSRSPHGGTILLSFDEVPVSTISFRRNAPGNVTVAVLDRLPASTADPPGDRLTQFRISVPRGLHDRPATVVFSVDVAALEAADIPNDAVWLTHYDDETGEWERLPTAVAHATDEEVVYRATTSDYSLFAIQGDSSQLRRSTPTEVPDGSEVESDDSTSDTDEPVTAIVGDFGFALGSVLLMGSLSVVLTVLGARGVSGDSSRSGASPEQR